MKPLPERKGSVSPRTGVIPSRARPMRTPGDALPADARVDGILAGRDHVLGDCSMPLCLGSPALPVTAPCQRRGHCLREAVIGTEMNRGPRAQEPCSCPVGAVQRVRLCPRTEMPALSQRGVKCKPNPKSYGSEVVKVDIQGPVFNYVIAKRERCLFL